MMHKTVAGVVLASLVAPAGADDASKPEQHCIPGEEQWAEVVRTFGRAQEFRAVLNQLAESDERVGRVDAIKRQAREEGTPLWKTDAGMLGLQVLEDFHRAVWTGGEWATFATAMDHAVTTEKCKQAGGRLPVEVWYWRNVKQSYRQVAELRQSLTEEFEVDEWHETASRREHELLMECGDSENALVLSCPAAARLFQEGQEWKGEGEEKYEKLDQAMRRACPGSWEKFSRWCPLGALAEAHEESRKAFDAWMGRKSDSNLRYYDALREEIPAWQALSHAMRAGGGTITFDAASRRKYGEANARERPASLGERGAADEIRRKKEAERHALREAIASEEAELEKERVALLEAGREEYIRQIKDKIERNWLRPPSTGQRLKCVVRVWQIPGGEVVMVEIQTSSGNDTFDRSVEEAVLRASPLPVPKDPSLFNRQIVMTFEPAG